MAQWRIRISLSDDPESRARLTKLLAAQQVPDAGALSGEVVLELPRDEELGDMLSALHTLSPQVFVSRVGAPGSPPAVPRQAPAETPASPRARSALMPAAGSLPRMRVNSPGRGAAPAPRAAHPARPPADGPAPPAPARAARR